MREKILVPAKRGEFLDLKNESLFASFN